MTVSKRGSSAAVIVKEELIHLGLQGKGPEAAVQELRERGIATTIGNAQKVFAVARREGIPIARFNKKESKKLVAIKSAAAKGSLSDEHTRARRDVASRYLSGYTESDIITGNFAPQLDAMEVVELCAALKPYRNAGKKLTYLKEWGYVPEDTATLVDAVDSLVSRVDSHVSTESALERERDELQGKNRELRGANADLKLNLSDERQKNTELENRLTSKRRYAARLEHSSSSFKKYLDQYGLDRLDELMTRFDNIESSESRALQAQLELQSAVARKQEIDRRSDSRISYTNLVCSKREAQSEARLSEVERRTQEKRAGLKRLREEEVEVIARTKDRVREEERIHKARMEETKREHASLIQQTADGLSALWDKWGIPQIATVLDKANLPMMRAIFSRLSPVARNNALATLNAITMQAYERLMFPDLWRTTIVGDLASTSTRVDNNGSVVGPMMVGGKVAVDQYGQPIIITRGNSSTRPSNNSQ